ncbi:hypothetical protein TWF694_001571 [Orbilia ellipsospora]|uniref:Uncharacterized protein n=1 Tax=Orbilia ellipsospora TaxID=2528407 RepID=A0AAV9XRZ3_9PEZI
MEVMYGSAGENKNYTGKEDGVKEGSERIDGPWEHGEMIKQGSHGRKRKRWSLKKIRRS